MDIPYNTISKMIHGGKKSEDPATAQKEDPAAANYDSIDSDTAPAVEHDHIDTQHEDKIKNVVSKDKIQDHYHTTVQPLKAHETLPEEHDYNQAATKEKSFEHDDAKATQAKLAAEKAKFEDSTTRTSSAATKTEETVAGEEHIHHHLHETIQPVIEKEITRPTITHTTVPIHETHHEASVVHGTSTAEAMSVDDFKKAGNALDSRSELGARDGRLAKDE